VDDPAFPGLASGARFPVLGIIMAVLLVLFIASTVPFAQTSSYSGTITNSSDPLAPHYTTYTPPQSGRFNFSWQTESGRAVAFTLLGPSGVAIYSSTAASGSGHLFVYRAQIYQFGFFNSTAETVRVTGTLSFAVPII
jgi:hypothetical protein